MTAGRRFNLITLQRSTATEDDHGGEVQTWSDAGQMKAAVFYGRGDERRQAAVVQGQQSATFQVPSSALSLSITLKDRIQHLGSTWDVRSISPDTPRRGEIEIEGVRSL